MTPPSTQSPTATPSPTERPPTPTPVPSFGPDRRWVRVANQRAFARSEMVAVAAGPKGYVAVGQAQPVRNAYVGVAWTSRDGLHWVRASTSWRGFMPAGVIHDVRVGFVAWGGAIWVSPDGTSWRRGPDRYVGGVAGVARLGDDLFAVGIEEVRYGELLRDELRVWTSQDGLVWQPVAVTTSSPWVDGSIYGVTSAEGAIIAWGRASVGDASLPVTLRSTDGRTWTVGGAGLEVSGYMSVGISDIVGTGGRFVAVGNGLGGDAGSPPPPAAAWTSPDGLAWTPAEFQPKPTLGALGDAVWTGSEYVALGRSVAWRSLDGTAWIKSASRTDEARDGEGPACAGGPCWRTVVMDLAAGPAGLVAVGATDLKSGGRRAVVWFAPTVRE